jgi:hypothetical protein
MEKATKGIFGPPPRVQSARDCDGDLNPGPRSRGGSAREITAQGGRRRPRRGAWRTRRSGRGIRLSFR